MRKIKCKKCGNLRHDTAFAFKDNSFELDTSECNLCKNPDLYKEAKEYFNKLINNG